MLEKPGAQNIAVCEKQGKQSELSGHWKSIKMLFLKKNNRRWHKKEKRMTGMQVLTKDFTSNKIRYKSLRKSNAVKPTSYWDLVKPINYRC